ncbi:tRNA (N6-isopentenyl adenosine(37)-C2)-methylthiotransferase MiaB [Anoxybacterium hadale]|uniref:tRNA (N6-isopentenyl adenosine(37)-C2)-methylthiotransferase MiaB n=1 Tax=Anoxybacterium hadale TaxID=3408580 RepID=A0ACD1AAZ6_9FIRM|nr:tRNA (N6-isopentenyl adenosine(37)-C2)-methylthiotransferase MiaB [Clostridiales bacterium]
MEKHTNLNKSFHIQTFGCQMNEHDSETLAGMLAEMGYIENENKRAADVAIINTCSVRENADKRFFGTLGQLKKVKEERPDVVVAVCGCMMQQQHIIDTLKTKYPWVDLIFGTHNLHEFPKLLTNVLNERSKIVDIWEDGGEIIEGLPAKRMYPFKAFVNIMYGCNNFCTYCIVPFTRGRERSRRPEEIVAEARSLAASGVREITLLGQNVNSYGNGSDFSADFADLIYQLNEIEGIDRIRFMTSHPKDLSDKLIAAFRDCKSLANYIHLPVQSGSSAVLKRMNRKYTKEDYLLLVEKLRAAVPDIAITTDIIVGFPGETSEDFEETMDLIRRVRFDSAFTFLYSIRKGTPAENYTDQVPEAEKHERFNRLVDQLNEITGEINKTYEGKVEGVLVEGPSKTNPQILTGRTESGKLVHFKGTEDMVGQIIPVKITEGKTFNLFGITETVE